MSAVTRPPGQPLTRRSPPAQAGERSSAPIGRRVLLIALLAFVALPLLVEALCPLATRDFLDFLRDKQILQADPLTFERIVDR